MVIIIRPRYTGAMERYFEVIADEIGTVGEPNRKIMLGRFKTIKGACRRIEQYYTPYKPERRRISK